MENPIVPDSGKLAGYTTVNSLEFKFDPVRSVCDLSLELENPTTRTSIALLLRGISDLMLKEFGGGLTQLLCLRIKDIRESQLDRLNFEVSEMGRGILKCQCRDFEILSG